MTFINGKGLILQKCVTRYNYKSYAIEDLEDGDDTIILQNVELTDKLQVFDHFGLLWIEDKHYERQGVNGEEIVFDPAMDDDITFTIFIFAQA